MINESIRAAVLWSAFFVVPVLLVLSFRGWLRQRRGSLPIWRGRLGLGSIAIVSAYWLSLPVWLFIEKHVGGSRLASLLGEAWMLTLIPAMILAATLTLALEGRTRAFAFAASMLMLVVFFLSTVE